MESFSRGNINLTRSGKSLWEANREPRQSGGIAVHASPRLLPANGPEATLQSTPVSQASPRGSGRLVLSGYMGARERDPQIRGLKIGSMRVGSGFTNHAAASARLKKRARRRKPSSIRSMEVAYDNRKYPGAPKASPGTRATRALSRRSLASSVVFLASALPAVPLARCAETLGNA